MLDYPIVNSDWNAPGVWKNILMRVSVTGDEIFEEPKHLLSIFSVDYEFDRDAIVQLWMAGRFFDNLGLSNTVEEEVLYTLEFQALEKLEYLLPTRLHNRTGKMMYKVNFSKVETCNQGKEGHPICFTSSVSSHVSLVADHVNDATIQYLKDLNNLTTLLFFPSSASILKHIPSLLFLAIKFVRALHLSGSHITEVPSSIRYLTHLRYLDLSFTLIARLPDSIDSLLELQTLKLAGCEHLFGLPKGVTKLRSLCYLDFDILGQLTCMPKGFGALTELRTLSAFLVDNRDGCNIMELKNLTNLRGTCCISGLENVPSHFLGEPLLNDKPGLTHLQLRWDPYNRKGEEHARIIYYLKPSPFLEELQVLCYPGSSLPFWMADNEFRMLGRISLMDCENLEFDIPLGELPNLKQLEIVQMNNVIQIDGRLLGADVHQIAFRKLESLVIDGMHNLETWDGIQSWDFPCLSALVIKNCPKLTALPFLAFLQSVRHLELSDCGILDMALHHTSLVETLIINHCPLLKKRYSKRGDDWDKIKHVQNIWIDFEDAHIEEQSIHSDDEYTSEDDSFTSDEVTRETRKME